MIRWCSYCQKFLGERAPFDDPSFTHGICERCDLRLERNAGIARVDPGIDVLTDLESFRP